MVVSQASDTVMQFVDRLFLSRIGEAHLSAAMSGGLTQFMVGSIFIGMVGYVAAIVAQYFGAKRYEKCAEATFQALVLACLCYPVLLAISPLFRHFFALMGQSPIQVELGYTYFQTLIFGFIFLVLRFALTGFFIGIGRTTVVMIANACGMLINIPANYVLIFGKLGFPELGLRGAAIGTILGNALIFAILLVFYLRGKNREDFNTHQALRFRPKIFRTLFRFGAPAGVEMFLCVSAFNLFVQLMHSYGTKTAAAVTIAFNWDIVAFLPMLGMGHAATALVGQNVGARDLQTARKSAFLSLKVAWIYSSSMVLLFVFATRTLVGLFASGFGTNAAEVSSLAMVMLRLAAVYILADSTQIIFAGALRGAGDTKWVMRTSVILHWIFVVVTFILIRVVQLDPVDVWIFFIFFVVSLGLAMFLRFRGNKWMQIEMINHDDDEAPALE